MTFIELLFTLLGPYMHTHILAGNFSLDILLLLLLVGTLRSRWRTCVIAANKVGGAVVVPQVMPS